jgi:3-methyladenine DNA glycosylase AlkD
MNRILEKDISKKIRQKGSKERAKLLSGYFKTGKGEYGEDDIFVGVKMPELRKIAQNHKDVSFSEVQKLLNSKIHENRMTALIILCLKFKEKPDEVFQMYVKNTKKINNWDLVDVSCHKIIGEYLYLFSYIQNNTSIFD